MAAQSFDATSYVLNALSSNNDGSISLVDALNRKSQFYGITGELSLNHNGEIYRKLPVMRIIKGEPVQITLSEVPHEDFSAGFSNKATNSTVNPPTNSPSETPIFRSIGNSLRR